MSGILLAIPFFLIVPLYEAGKSSREKSGHTRFESSASFDWFTSIVWISVVCFGVGFWWVVTKAALAAIGYIMYLT